MNPIVSQQAALNNALVPSEKRLKIKRCNARISFTKSHWKLSSYLLAIQLFRSLLNHNQTDLPWDIPLDSVVVLRNMNPIVTQQAALNNALVPSEKRLKIERCNAIISFTKSHWKLSSYLLAIQLFRSLLKSLKSTCINSGTPSRR
nr:hypothetical protein [Tanacetum cinerariifolium]